MRGARRLLFAALVGLLALTGCKATATVAIAVNPDASGTVTVSLEMDEQAAGRIGADVSEALKLDDLREAGWEVDGPTTRGGETTVAISKPFAHPDGLAPIVAEISGPEGPIRDVSLTTEIGFGTSDYRLRARVALTGDLAQFSDVDIANALDGLPVGRTPEELAAAFAEDPEALTLRIRADLPGDSTELGGFREGDGAVVASFAVGQGEEIDRGLVAESSLIDRSPLLWIGVGVVLVVGALALLRPRRRRTPRNP